MKILNLKKNNFLEIFDFLSLKEIISLKRGSYSNSDSFLHRKFAQSIGEENPESLVNWKTILLNMSRSESSSDFVPFFTDGGTHADHHLWFIHNLIKKNGTHCTVKPKNILLKYVYNPSPNLRLYKNQQLFRLDQHTYYIKELETDSEVFKNSCQTIEKITFCVPDHFFTCPVKVLMFFGSLHKCENFDIVKQFYDCTEIEMTEKIAVECGLNYKITENKALIEMKFKGKGFGIFPLSWVKIKARDDCRNDYSLCVDEIKFAKYFYVLLLDSQRVRGFNIDVGEIYAQGKNYELWVE